jgi:hypothetical protein
MYGIHRWWDLQIGLIGPGSPIKPIVGDRRASAMITSSIRAVPTTLAFAIVINAKFTNGFPAMKSQKTASSRWALRIERECTILIITYPAPPPTPTIVCIDRLSFGFCPLEMQSTDCSAVLALSAFLWRIHI